MLAVPEGTFLLQDLEVQDDNNKSYKEEPRARIQRRRIPAIEMVGWGTERTRMPEVSLGRFSSCSVPYFPL